MIDYTSEKGKLWALGTLALFLVLLATSLLRTQHPHKYVGTIPPESPLQVGDEAPDFNLGMADGEGHLRLSDFRGRRPVALIFGSYT